MSFIDIRQIYLLIYIFFTTYHGARDEHLKRAISHTHEKFIFLILLVCPKEGWFFSAWLWTLEFLSLHVPLTFQLWFYYCPEVTGAKLGIIRCWVAFLFFFSKLRKPIALYPSCAPAHIFSVLPVSHSSCVGPWVTSPRYHLQATCSPPGISTWTLQWSPMLTSSQHTRSEFLTNGPGSQWMNSLPFPMWDGVEMVLLQLHRDAVLQMKQSVTLGGGQVNDAYWQLSCSVLPLAYSSLLLPWTATL